MENSCGTDTGADSLDMMTENNSIAITSTTAEFQLYKVVKSNSADIMSTHTEQSLDNVTENSNTDVANENPSESLPSKTHGRNTDEDGHHKHNIDGDVIVIVIDKM